MIKKSRNLSLIEFDLRRTQNCKVRTFWKGHKNLKCQIMWEIVSSFVTFLENLNFNVAVSRKIWILAPKMFNISAAESKFKILKCHNKKFVKTSYVNLDCNFDWIPAICLLLFHRNNFKKFSSTKVRKFLISMWVQNLKPEKQWELKIIIFRSKFESVLFNIGKTGAISIII